MTPSTVWTEKQAPATGWQEGIQAPGFLDDVYVDFLFEGILAVPIAATYVERASPATSFTERVAPTVVWTEKTP